MRRTRVNKVASRSARAEALWCGLHHGHSTQRTTNCAGLLTLVHMAIMLMKVLFDSSAQFSGRMYSMCSQYLCSSNCDQVRKLPSRHRCRLFITAYASMTQSQCASTFTTTLNSLEICHLQRFLYQSPHLPITLTSWLQSCGVGVDRFMQQRHIRRAHPDRLTADSSIH